MPDAMTCDERVASAHEINKIKIYPDGSMVIEKSEHVDDVIDTMN